jgi:tetratricopeptide (TPR) repeat protein
MEKDGRSVKSAVEKRKMIESIDERTGFIDEIKKEIISANTEFEKGNNYFSMGEYSNAIDTYNALIKKYKSVLPATFFAPVYNNIGLAYYFLYLVEKKSGYDINRATTSFDQLNPIAFSSLLIRRFYREERIARGVLRGISGTDYTNLQKAGENFWMALKYNPRYIPARLNLIMIEADTGCEVSVIKNEGLEEIFSREGFCNKRRDENLTEFMKNTEEYINSYMEHARNAGFPVEIFKEYMAILKNNQAIYVAKSKALKNEDVVVFKESLKDVKNIIVEGIENEKLPELLFNSVLLDLYLSKDTCSVECKENMKEVLQSLPIEPVIALARYVIGNEETEKITKNFKKVPQPKLELILKEEGEEFHIIPQEDAISYLKTGNSAIVTKEETVYYLPDVSRFDEIIKFGRELKKKIDSGEANCHYEGTERVCIVDGYIWREGFDPIDPSKSKVIIEGSDRGIKFIFFGIILNF